MTTAIVTSTPPAWQPPLPDRYLQLSETELSEAISARRAKLGDALLILGHHYQQDEVIRHADLTGDSLKLSRLAAEQASRRGTRFVVFCGVHFMAETADMLTDDEVAVILPDLSAGCSMADMADAEDVEDAWAQIHDVLDPGEADHVVPVTYVNSSAAVKAFVGAHGGACCTSSNAAAVLQWALNGGERAGDVDPRRVRILFVPDQHLGRNTARAMGLRSEIDHQRGAGPAEMAVWDPHRQMGGLGQEQIRAARVLLWAGHCSVHRLFRAEHVREAREALAEHGPCTVMVHPECAQEVVELADASGSTEAIIQRVRAAEPGTSWAIGTEIHLVDRLAREAAQRGVHVRILGPCQCLCTTMYRIDQPHLLWALDNLVDGRIVNQISVPRAMCDRAQAALDRMLGLVSPAPGAVPARA